jgi:D-inositol-3-phosphate glycosyltransferase
MMKRPHIVHLIDDTTAGGVMRVLDHIRQSPELARNAVHSFKQVKRGTIAHGRIDADVIVSHLTLNWRGLTGLFVLRASNAGRKLVHVEHSYTESFVALNVAKPRRFMAMLRTSFALFDTVVAVSKAQGDWMLRRDLLAPSGLRVIRSAVDLTEFTRLDPVSGPVQVIGAIGRLDTQKGFDLLIQAFRLLPNNGLRLAFYGEGPERPALEALAAGDARISFEGFAADPMHAMSQVDAIAMPSRWEAFGLVAQEALAAGRTVLVSGVDGLAEQSADGAVNVGAMTVAAWTRALGDLNEGKHAGASIPARQTHCSQSRAAFATGWNDLFDELLGLGASKAAAKPSAA